MLERRSALVPSPHVRDWDASVSCSRLRMAELRGWTLVHVGAFAPTLTALEQVVGPLLGMCLPRNIGIASRTGSRCVLKVGATQFWIVSSDNSELAHHLPSAVQPDVGVVTSLSHSSVRIVLEGEAAREILSMSVPLDMHPEAFGVERFALTGLHHTPVLIHCVGERRFDVYARRTFAPSVWQWLDDAARSLRRS